MSAHAGGLEHPNEMPSLLLNRPVRLVLASRSPRRHELLSRLGVDFEIAPADIDETHAPGADARTTAEAVAERKARAVAAGRRSGLILGADTVVVLDGAILGKPADRADAAAMLGRLTGRTHTVITGMALVDAASGRGAVASETTQVTMRAATPAEIAAYVATGEPMDKAGAYGAQGIGALFVERVEGCFYNVVGLPLARLDGLLRRFDGVMAAGCRPIEERCE